MSNIGKTGQSTRKTYQKKLPSDNSKDYYFIHRNTGVTEPLIVEYGFIDDTKSKVDFLNNNYKRLADAVIESILEYKEIEPSDTEGILLYTIKKGDTLYNIANEYETTVDDIKKLNNLSNNLLTVGEVLKIPTSNFTTDTYVVKRGDTLYNIANRYNTTVNELKRLNKLVNDTLSVGEILLVPTLSSNVVPISYVVKAGDTLYSISRDFGVAIDEIKDINTLTTNVLSVGQKLLIPVKQSNYTVKQGDTLYSIAKTYNTTVAQIKEINNLTSNNLSVGQKLLIR